MLDMTIENDHEIQVPELKDGKVLAYIQSVEKIAITDDASQVSATAVNKVGKELLKHLEEKKKEMLVEPKKMVDDINETFKPFLTNLKASIDKIGSMVVDYQRAKDAEIERLNALEAKKHEKKVERAEAKGLDIEIAPPVKIETSNKIATEAGSSHFRETRTFEVIDVSKIPAKYMIPDLVTIGKIIRAGGDIDGVKVIIKKTLV